MTATKPPQADIERPIVFFSGGTALRALSAVFAALGRHTVHLVTTFDSGGSTARLRAAFAMPALGDLRNRLVALADPALCCPALIQCMNTRLPKEGDQEALRAMLLDMGNPAHPVWKGLKATEALTLQQCLQAFLQAMPARFDARKASLGNLFMAGRYLQEHRSLNAVMALFSRLLHVHGEVLPIVEESLHLAAVLDDGSICVGQHHFKDFTQPIRSCFLTVHEPDRDRNGISVCSPRASSAALARLRQAGLVCYPMGSFFSSVMANLLAGGVADAIASQSCPKIFIPNTGADHELCGCTLTDELRILVQTLCQTHSPGQTAGAESQARAAVTAEAAGAGGTAAATAPAATEQTESSAIWRQPGTLHSCGTAWKQLAGRFVSHMLIDSRHGRYPGDVQEALTLASTLGITVIDTPMIQPDGQHHAPERLAALLVQLRDAGLAGGSAAAGAATAPGTALNAAAAWDGVHASAAEAAEAASAARDTGTEGSRHA